MMKQDVLEVLKIKEIFTLLHHGLQAFTIFLKNSFCGFYHLMVASLLV